MPQAALTTDAEIRNAFRGWTLNKNYGKVYDDGEDLTDIIMNLSKYSVIQDYDLYAVFQQESVYASNTDNKYFIYSYNDNGDPIISLNPELGNDLAGKITLPAKNPNGEYILGIGKMLYAENPTRPIGKNITHIFFEPNNQYQFVDEGAFSNYKATRDNPYAYTIKEIYLPKTITSLGPYSFECLMDPVTVYMSDNVTEIGY
jgi:hypothetical protein